MNVIIVGGGWAGLSAAVELCRHNINVTVIEAAKQLGGRARTVHHQGQAIDNGQHLMMGAYHHVLEILDTIGVDLNEVLLRQPLKLIIKNKYGTPLRLSPSRLPAPWHLATALLTAQGLSCLDRWRALRFCRALTQSNTTNDISVQAALIAQRQSPALIEQLWQPLCLAMLNTATHEASFDIFRHALVECFVHHRHDSDALFARVNLSALLPTPCQSYIEAQGGTIQLGCRAQQLTIENGRISHLQLNDGSCLSVDQLILATPPFASQRLLEPHAEFSALATQLGQFDSAPICTIYLQYPASVKLEQAMIGISGTLSQWVFDRRLYQQAGLMAVVISGTGQHLELGNKSLIEKVSSELAEIFPDWPAPAEGFVMREKRATFVSRVGINQIRPGYSTAVSNCWLAGDYINNGYPATLESAALSGMECARQLCKQSLLSSTIQA